jgi:hypothetical protein
LELVFVGAGEDGDVGELVSKLRLVLVTRAMRRYVWTYRARQDRRQHVAGVRPVSFDRREAGHQACAVDVRLDVGPGDATNAFQRGAAEVAQYVLVAEFPVCHQSRLLGLHDGAAERQWGRRVCEQLFDGFSACALAEDCDLFGVAAEFRDVGSDPLEGEALV